jgi:hypothetical protein
MGENMKVRFLVGMLALACASQSAQAGDQDFKLVNRTGFDVREIYVSPTKRSTWGRDVLGTGMLHNGNQVPIRFPATNSICVYDIKVVYTDDDSTEWT